MGVGDILSLARYSPEWRLGRRIFHQEFNSNTSLKYVDIQKKYARWITMQLNIITDTD